MIQMIIAKTPLYVWPLLTYIIWKGIALRKTREVPLKILLIIPLVFTIWSCYSILTRYDLNAVMIGAWLSSIALGVMAGWILTRSLALKFDREKKRVEVPGSWVTLILCMTIFSVKYFLGVTYALQPELIGNWGLFALDLVPSAISGLCIGRLLRFWQKYRIFLQEETAA